jgi:hypothetical protein
MTRRASEDRATFLATTAVDGSIAWIAAPAEPGGRSQPIALEGDASGGVIMTLDSPAKTKPDPSGALIGDRVWLTQFDAAGETASGCALIAAAHPVTVVDAAVTGDAVTLTTRDGPTTTVLPARRDCRPVVTWPATTTRPVRGARALGDRLVLVTGGGPGDATVEIQVLVH